MTALSLVMTILGLVATIIGSILAYFAYISPLTRLDWYLKRPEKWNKVFIERHRYNWQYKNHPEFTIEIDDDGEMWGTQEKWMPYCPDPSKHSSLVKVRVNGQIMMTESFLFLDGQRYFVPVAKRDIIGESEDNYKYYYTPIQIKLSKIVGDFHGEKSVYNFMDQNGLESREGKDE